jgi:hypothetical protein
VTARDPDRDLELEPASRHVAAGGWRRAVVGLVVGAVAGALVGLVVPRDQGPRRTVRPSDRPQPYED